MNNDDDNHHSNACVSRRILYCKVLPWEISGSNIFFQVGFEQKVIQIMQKSMRIIPFRTFLHVSRFVKTKTKKCSQRFQKLINLKQIELTPRCGLRSE